MSSSTSLTTSSSSSSSGSELEQTTIYDAIGGSKAMELAVDVFYTKVLADHRVQSFFEGIDMDRQRRMQVHFLTFALGGPYKYNGRAMRVVHRRLVERQGLNDAHFDVIVELLSGTLRELSVDERFIDQVKAKCESIRDDILCRDVDADVNKKTASELNQQPQKKTELAMAQKEVNWARVVSLVMLASALLVCLLLSS